ncbi:serine/threonine-protein kinase [Luteimicrobium subarcticum]|uniref:non-specific serine/threonine protein kinase n=1 Tax=Luteimicrobium subarcticum TaxID=620910 RepID=A0A2M8WVQ0_9MICO|nr:serine/threonine-protein kinase [Luteimicrobium subarcticum]PJI94983.1 serine/threonine protein kinase [Luteimicrobium subarcticum]
MSKRAPSPPPQIPGFEHLQLVGSGGFADVFLYQQQRPRRRVAVKVLLHEWSSPGQRAAFEGEADVMARLSTHPSIVTIYEADVAPDGRPYLAMEYCSRPSLGTRYRTERLGVAESLRVVVQIAGAVETAHRAGILHRDIKPANILGTDYGHPVLTDFGISSTVDDVTRAEGLSIPWSPPESFEEPPRASAATDVWALGATLYSFLAGRSPFEVPGGSNSSAELVQRICAQPLAPTGRSDAPPSLEMALATAMAKNPQARYPSVLELARALQHVQIELGLAVTPIDLLDDSGVVQDDVVSSGDDDQGTRLRGVVSIDPSGAGGARAPRPAQGGAPGTPGGRSDVADPWQAARRPGRDVPPTFDAPVPVAPPAVHDDTARVAVVEPAPQFASSTPVALVSAPQGLQVPQEDTVLRPDTGTSAPGTWDPGTPGPAGGPGRGRVVALVGGGVAVLAAVVVAAALLLGGGRGGTPDPVVTDADGGQVDGGGDAHDNLGDLVPSVRHLEGSAYPALGDAVFTWDQPADSQIGDTYAYQVVDPTSDDSPWVTVAGTNVDLPITQDPMCLKVVVVRDGKFSANPTHACATAQGD